MRTSSARDPTAAGHALPARRASLIEQAADRRRSLHAEPLSAGELRLQPAKATTTQTSPTLGTSPTPRSSSSPPHPVVLDLARIHARGIASPEQTRNVTAEEFRRIKRSVLAEARDNLDQDRPGNLIMVTSALPGEGKTFVSLGLALNIALERNQRVLCVDGDLVRPRLHAEMGVSAAHGLLDLLLDPQRPAADVILRTNVPGLDVLIAGKPHELSNELIGSQRMRTLLGELSDRYTGGIVVFDSSPVLVTNEAVALAPLMSQVLMVVAAEKTSKASVEAAAEQLAGVRSLKLVLNQTRRSFFDRMYYGGYYR